MNDSSPKKSGEEWGKTSTVSASTLSDSTTVAMENGKQAPPATLSPATTLGHLSSHLRRTKGESCSIPVGIAVAWKRTDIDKSTRTISSSSSTVASSKKPTSTKIFPADPSDKNGGISPTKQNMDQQDCNIPKKKLPTPISSPKMPKRPSSTLNPGSGGGGCKDFHGSKGMPERPSSVMPTMTSSRSSPTLTSSIMRNPYLDPRLVAAYGNGGGGGGGYGSGNWFGGYQTLGGGPTKNELLMLSYPHFAQQQHQQQQAQAQAQHLLELQHQQQQHWIHQHLLRESYAAHGLLPHGILPTAEAYLAQQQEQLLRHVQNFHQSLSNHTRYQSQVPSSLSSPALSIPSPSLVASKDSTTTSTSVAPPQPSGGGPSLSSLWPPEYYHQNSTTTLSPRSLSASSPSPGSTVPQEVRPLLLPGSVPQLVVPQQPSPQQSTSGPQGGLSSLPLPATAGRAKTLKSRSSSKTAGGTDRIGEGSNIGGGASTKSTSVFCKSGATASSSPGPATGVERKPEEQEETIKEEGEAGSKAVKSPKRTLEAITASLASAAALTSSAVPPPQPQQQVKVETDQVMKLEQILGVKRRHDFSCMESLIEKRDDSSVPLLKSTQESPRNNKDSQEKKPLCSPNTNYNVGKYFKNNSSDGSSVISNNSVGKYDGVPEENLPPKKSPGWKREMLDKTEFRQEIQNKAARLPHLIKVEIKEEEVALASPTTTTSGDGSQSPTSPQSDPSRPVEIMQGVVTKRECDTDERSPSNNLVPDASSNAASKSLTTSSSEPNIPSVASCPSDIYAPSAALLQLASAIASVGNMNRIQQQQQQQQILPLEKRRNTTDCDYHRQLRFDDNQNSLNLLASVALSEDRPSSTSATTAIFQVSSSSSPSIQQSSIPVSQSSISPVPVSHRPNAHSSPPMASVAPALLTPPMGTESATAIKSELPSSIVSAAAFTPQTSMKSPKRKGRLESSNKSNEDGGRLVPKLKLRRSPARSSSTEDGGYNQVDNFEIAKPLKHKKQIKEEKKVLPLKLKKRRMTDNNVVAEMSRSNNRTTDSKSVPHHHQQSPNKKKDKNMTPSMRPDLKIKIVNNHSSLVCVDNGKMPGAKFGKSYLKDAVINGNGRWIMSSPAPTTSETATTATTDWEADPTLAVKAIQVEVNKTGQWLAQHMSRFGKHNVEEEQEEDDISSSPVNLTPTKKSPGRTSSSGGSTKKKSAQQQQQQQQQPTIKPCLKPEPIVKQRLDDDEEDEDIQVDDEEEEEEELPSINDENSNDAAGGGVFARFSTAPRRFSVNKEQDETQVAFLRVDELVDEMRILTEIQGLFYTGKLNALQPPDVYGVTLDNERGAPPHFIFSAEEVLEKCVREIKPSKLYHGLRICAYWSPMYSGLYAGKVSVDYVPGGNEGHEMIPIEFDDGDTGLIKRTEIRMLPQNHPMREYDPNPLQTLEKKQRKRRHSSANTSRSGGCTGDHEEDDCGESYCAKLPKILEDEEPSLYGYQSTKMLYWTWKGTGYRKPKSKKDRNKEFFKGIRRGDEEINVGDAALFVSHGNVRPYIGRVEKFYEKKGKKVVSVRWFYHPEEVQVSPKKLQGLKYAGALFESPHIDENDVQTIARKCDVRSFENFRRRNQLMDWSKDTSYTGESYYVAGFYDPYKYTLQLKDLRY